MVLSRLLAIAKKEVIQIRRDKPSLIIALAMPVIMLFLFGYAVRTDVDNISSAVFDQDRTRSSRSIVQSYANSKYFSILKYVNSRNELTNEINSGKVKVGIIIPRGYQEKILKGQKGQIQVIIDGSDPTVSRTALSVAQVVAQAKSAQLISEILYAQGQIIPNIGIDMRPRILFNPSMESIRFNIPGLIGLILQNITIMLTAFALVREKERGTMEQLIVTPIKAGELILGKLLPYTAIAFVDVCLTLIIGVFWFKVPVNGSIVLLMTLSFLFLLGALGIGMFISTIAKTQLQAMQMTVVIILPSFLLSGFIFPRESMPKLIYLLGYFIPLTYFLEILRGIILKGIGITLLWKDALLLAVFGIGILGLSAFRVKKTIE
jgi:ABC-2 type transport system permease protein